MARPSKLTAEVQDRLCEALRAGATYEIAAAVAGVSYRSFARWMHAGQRARTGRYWQFWQTMWTAIADSALWHLRNVTEQARDDWRASAWVLEHRFPADYGTVRARLGVEAHVETSGAGGGRGPSVAELVQAIGQVLDEIVPRDQPDTRAQFAARLLEMDRAFAAKYGPDWDEEPEPAEPSQTHHNGRIRHGW